MSAFLVSPGSRLGVGAGAEGVGEVEQSGRDKQAYAHYRETAAEEAFHHILEAEAYDGHRHTGEKDFQHVVGVGVVAESEKRLAQRQKLVPQHHDGAQHGSHVKREVKFKRISSRKVEAEDGAADLKMAA